MPKPKRSGRQQPTADLGPRELGLRAFHAGRFDAAITTWQPLIRDPAVAHALAEAHFRRALTRHAADPIADLRRASLLEPADLRFQLHLGRLLHRAGDLAAAANHYSLVLSREPGNIAAAKLFALLTLEQRSDADLSGLPGMSPALHAWAAPALAVLRRQPPPADESPLGTLWRGLGQLALGSPDARATLSDERALPTLALEPLRRYFRATAAALAGDTDAALRIWERIYDSGERPPGLEERLATLLLERLAALLDSGPVAAAGDLALRWANLSGGAAFDELRLLALSRAAAEAAAAGAWPKAAQLWEAARQVLGHAQGLGSPRPILHNLALAYERQERWEDAADAWRALLRTRARKRAADVSEAQEEQRWAWVRSRIISCYRSAGRPDEAVTVFRQAIKLDPNDLDLRIQLADALLANEQERASQNEIKRILEIDPHHPEALLRQVEHLSEHWQFAEAERLVRELAERNPDRADLHRRVAAVFMQHGRELSQYGNFQAAYNAFVEGERYGPNDPHFPLNQARMLRAMRRPVDTGALIERALTVAGESVETWLLAIETWVMADKLDEARALIDRFERERAPSAEDLTNLGIHLMSSALPPPTPAFFALAAPPKPVDTPSTRLALEVLDKAVALRPDDPRILKSITSFLMLPRPDLALRFAERLVQQAPDDPEALIVQGVVFGLSNKTSEAKTTLQRAAKLAQRLGRPDLHAQAEDLRRVVGTPMLRMMFTQTIMDGIDEFDEFF
ncbi:MAG: tetratricopeptide repeat protein [Chloroflexales bacterium]